MARETRIRGHLRCRTAMSILSSIGRMDRPPRHGSQCQFGKGTTTLGIPIAVNDWARGRNSALPVKNPGTITAALIDGRSARDPPSPCGLVVEANASISARATNTKHSKGAKNGILARRDLLLLESSRSSTLLTPRAPTPTPGA